MLSSLARNSYRSFLNAAGLLVQIQEMPEPSRLAVPELALRRLLQGAGRALRLAANGRNEQIPKIPKFARFRNSRNSVPLLAGPTCSTDFGDLLILQFSLFLVGGGGRGAFSETVIGQGPLAH